MNTRVVIDDNGYFQLIPSVDLSLPTIIVSGDLCPIGKSGKLLSTNQVDEAFSDIIPLLQAADLSITNLECPLTPQATHIAKSGPHLKADPACAIGIHSVGFDVVSLANNHILDMGDKGLMDTVNACAHAGLKTVGAGENLTQATQTMIVDIRGIRVAILAFAEHEFSIATSSSAGAWPLDPIDNYYQLRQAKSNADFVLVLLHGGNEHYILPNPTMVKLCRYFVDLGANAVVCNHVHVPSGIEIYEGAPIVYSTGNLLFESKNEIDDWYRGYLVRLTIQPSAVVVSQLIPYWQSKDKLGIRLMDIFEQKQLFTHLTAISAVIMEPAKLKKEWALFVRSQRLHYLGVALGLNKVERQLLRLGLWPFWRLKRSYGASLLNLFTCESHRDVMISLLSSEFLTSES